MQLADGITESQRTAAKVVAIAFPVSFFCVVYANFGMRGGLFAGADMAATIQRINAGEMLIRASIILDLAYCIGFAVLISALYTVLRPVNQRVALLATVAKMVYLVTAVLMAFSLLNVVHLAADPSYQQTLGSDQIQGLVRLSRTALWDQYYVGLVFWAFSSTLYAWLWFKSRYIPRPLALFGVVSSAWCTFCALAYLARPAFSSIVNLWVFDVPMVLFLFALSGWILVKGLPKTA